MSYSGKNKSFIESSFVYSVIFILYFPIFILLLLSFTSAGGFDLTPYKFTWKWYKLAMMDDDLYVSCFISLIVAISSSIASTLLGLSSAIYLYLNPSSKLSKIFQKIQVAMLVMPDIIVGSLILLLFSMLKLELGYSSMIIAHTTAFSSFSFFIILSRLHEISKSILDAAKDLGASIRDIVFGILVPSCKMSILSSFVIVFGISIDDVVISYFTSGFDKPFTVFLYSNFKYGSPQDLVSYSSILIIIVCMVLLVGCTSFSRGYLSSFRMYIKKLYR
ncbi:MAG: ABC transporter permease subunit [Chlamydiia bacterium]|nr:ABC transporter permease subunit [Chlamydiia bacterium]